MFRHLRRFAFSTFVACLLIGVVDVAPFVESGVVSVPVVRGTNVEIQIGNVAEASFEVNATNEYLTATFTSSYTCPFTIAGWIKPTDVDATFRGIAVLGEATNDPTPGIGLNHPATADALEAFDRESGGGGDFRRVTGSTDAYNGVWTLVVAVCGSANTDRRLYVNGSSTNSGTSSTAVTRSSGMQYFTLGNNNGSQGWTSGNPLLLANFCGWDEDIGTTNIDALWDSAETGPDCKTIDPTHVKFAYSLDSAVNGLLNAGSDTSGDLTASGATYNADHPTITSSGVTQIRMLQDLGSAFGPHQSQQLDGVMQ